MVNSLRTRCAIWFLDSPFGKRHVEAFSFFLAVFLGFSIRVNLSLTIVAMTDPNANEYEHIPTYDWKNRNVILSSFFWGYVIPQIGAGWLMTRYGPKWFLIVSMFLGCAVGFLIPPLAGIWGSTSVIVFRVIQGLCQGFILPSVPCFMGNWVPIGERGRIGTFVYAAGPLGTVFSMLIAGVISASRLGWPWVFHFFSILGILWCIFYAIIGRNTPAEHPRISRQEREYIEKTAAWSIKRHMPTPWKAIFTSVPFLALFFSYACFIFGFWVLLTQIPTYMNEILKFNIRKNGVLSALPYILQWVTGLTLSIISDKMILTDIISIWTARKTMNAIGMLIPALALILLGQCSKDTSEVAVILLIIAVGANGATFCGTFINNLDLSPNFAGVLYGIMNG
uniref:Putative inorganic phosphate cotransporter n=1 Tax=Diabrotica virgifera virgifera TaxID=50390 RepID=A0A6P7GM52_DIAVI